MAVERRPYMATNDGRTGHSPVSSWKNQHFLTRIVSFTPIVQRTPRKCYQGFYCILQIADQGFYYQGFYCKKFLIQIAYVEGRPPINDSLRHNATITTTEGDGETATKDLPTLNDHGSRTTIVHGCTTTLYLDTRRTCKLEKLSRVLETKVLPIFGHKGKETTFSPPGL